MMNEAALVKRVRRQCAAAGSQKDYAAMIGVSKVKLNRFLTGQRSPSASLLRALGYEKITRVEYRELSDGERAKG